MASLHALHSSVKSRKRWPVNYDVDRGTHPRLHGIVMANMIHRPCDRGINLNSPCMDGDKYTKTYPKEFDDETLINTNGYPIYRRRDTGRTESMTRNGRQYQIDNRWVVPYNS